jgi:hypothetical protein
MQIRLEKMRVNKLKVRKPKRDDWKRERQAMRKAKQNIQERYYA